MSNYQIRRKMTKEQIERYIKEHILKGDRGDGIPNFLSADNTFAIGERQKTINNKKLTEWLSSDPSKFCSTDTMMRGYKRNQMLIDLDFTPTDIKSKIVEAYDECKPKSKTNMLNYFM